MSNPSNSSTQDYHVWPIFMLAFIRLFYVSIFERALFNYLYFTIEIRESTLGFISSAGALSYIVAPVLGQLLTKKIGLRKAIILNSILTPVLSGAQILYSVPWFLIICRVGLGLSMGLFWPNCLYLLSKWQRISTAKKSKKNFALFNFSWNSGFILGLLVGFVWAFSWNDYLTMIISWVLSFLLIPVSFFIKKEFKSPDSKEKLIYQTEDPISHLDIEEDLFVNSNTPMIVFPILFSWLGIMYLAISKTVLIFGYPILLKAFDSPSYLTYLVQAGMQFTQLISLTLINYMKVYTRKIASILSILGLSILTVTIILVENIFYISILIACVGLLLGFIHGTSMKIMLEYGTAKQSTKYSIINEVLIGISFGFTPIIAGYVAEVNLYYNYLYIIIIGFCMFFALVYISRNVKRTPSHFIDNV
ncbi:hypothetical protein LCGC14_0412770 [marine sediment metagenome]|uniref:Major facilitator superfamily (MFS) profile domain-containing protein n=1 Tax=marine sediment metagenome TaxID=412755 RepID=A0A0F9W2B8_9ZZZZ|nr:MFS transporter [archaeon]